MLRQKMQNSECKNVDLTGERQQQLHATHVVSPIAACKYCLSALLNLDLFRPIIRPSGCLSGASLLVGRACLASGCLACAALSSGGCQRQSHALVRWACACQQCAFSTADCLLWMGKAQKQETMSAEVRRICLQSPSTECAASEACNAHHHATLQHSLPLRPRQQEPPAVSGNRGWALSGGNSGNHGRRPSRHTTGQCRAARSPVRAVSRGPRSASMIPIRQSAQIPRFR